MKTLHALFLFGLFFFAMPAFAQLPADQGFLIKTELDKRGLSQAEAEAALIANGLDVNKMSPEELIAKQGEITGVLDGLAAAKKETVVPEPTQTVILPPDTVVKVQPVVVETIQATETIKTTQEKVPEAAIPDAVVNTGIYGHEIFVDKRIEVIATTDGASAPETYVLGAGDQIRITIFGISQADLLLTINEAGFVSPSGMGQIYLKGLTLKEARKVVRNRFSVAYRFQTDEFALTLQQARMLTVNIFGETQKSGSVQLSALNTALNALGAVGGPTELGSVRAIELIRGETRKKIDLYAFLNNPSAQFQFDLQHNDILFVPVVQKIVSIKGAIKRPMRYELISKEGLKELITFAGGINYNTLAEFIQIERYSGAEPLLMEYRLSEVLSGAIKIELLDGDIVRVKSNNKTLEQYTEVAGAVFYPGTYELKPSMTLAQLLAKTQLKPQADTQLYFVERTLTDGTRQIVKVDSASAGSFTLDKKDKISVFDITLYTDQLELEVQGAVRSPFKKLLSIYDQLSVADALALAGGLKVSATDTAYVFRQDILKPGSIQFIPLVPSTQGSTLLKAGDILRIFDRNEYMDVANIEVDGAVREPFKKQVAIGNQLTLAEALVIARGTLPTSSTVAYLRSKDWFNPEVYQYRKVDLTDSAFTLKAGDKLTIYDKSVFTIASSVRINGAINTPQTMPYSSDLNIKDVMLMAGGKTRATDLSRVEIYRLVHNNKRGSGYEKISLKLDSNYNVVGQNSNYALLPFDQVYVRTLPMFGPDKSVQANGEVKYPGAYPFPAKVYRLSDLIADAGGLNLIADRRYAIILREGIGPVGVDLKKALRRKHSKKFNPFLLVGDVLTVSPTQNTFSIRTTGTRYPAIDGKAVQEVGFLYAGRHTSRWYLREYAGGLVDDADRSSIAVAYPNGQVDGTKRALFLFNDMPTVRPGGQIVVSLQSEEVKAEKKEVDYDAVFTRSFQAISSLLTLMLLVNQL